jgi:ABC-type uncharacterized transport system substrate-binding protein
MVPERLVVNQSVLKGLRELWTLPSTVLARADEVIDEEGMKHEKAAVASAVPQERTYKIGLAYFAPEAGVESAIKGVLDGLKDAGLSRDVNLDVRAMHAQGEIANLVPMLQQLDAEGLDVIIPMTTPALTAAVATLKRTPAVFTYVYDPIAAGVGNSFTDHAPLITGVGSFPPLEETIEVVTQLVPGIHSVGTLYNSSEANSRKVVSVARNLFGQRGLTLEELTVSNTSEVYQAATVLIARGIQALWVTGDNTALQAFDGIVKAAREQKIPLIINDPEFIDRGALAAVGIGFYHSGRAAGRMAARVLRGEPPQGIPIENLVVKEVRLNREMAEFLGIRIPQSIVNIVGASSHETVAASH